ncbi:MAG: hypothetical protein ABIN80_09225 [Dyadobacter sp.]|uniref:hypothetical protein n=1 Tax=Dyadobacter sp. TaxID=1914288 RepID=UPI003263A7E0
MEKLGSSERALQGKAKGKTTKTQPVRYVVPSIPDDVKLSDFVRGVPVDLEAALRLSEKKMKK